MFVATCIFWLACAAFAGLCAAFFWCQLELEPQTKHTLTARSVIITWIPTILNCCSWVILWLPFLIYLAVFRFAVDRGIDFWNSNHPREWIGDFSDPDATALNAPDET